jgi:hypothetical protein
MHHLVRLKVPVILCSSLFFFSSVHAENHTLVDKYHKVVSEQVLYWANYLDNEISSWFLSEEDLATCPPVKPFTFTQDPTEELDSFFQSNRYLNDNRDIYVRVRFNSYFYTKEPNKMNMQVSAQLPFDRCKERWNLFFQEEENNNNEIKTTDTSNSGVGIRYEGKDKFGIKSSYSLGLSSGSPYVRARYKYPLTFGKWKIEPIQIFKYSSKYYFEDETDIYFDRSIHHKDLFRIQLYRKSAYDIEGMDYGLTFQYYWNLGKDAGIELTQSFFGNTAYNDYYAFDKDYNGINNYVTSISWRKNIWRKWFYYEIKPSVNFHKDHDYKPTYAIRFLVDFYFGDYH